jgi:N-acetyl-anhydromuramyl-L-alanine amidase AmpD
MVNFETDSWPYVPAKWQKKVVGHREVLWIMVHAMESPEKGDTAESCGHWFQTCPKPASSHIGVDSNSIVQYVHDNDVAYGAPGANHAGIHIEHAGYTQQGEAQWLDPYGVLMLELSARACAQYCLKYDVPARKIGPGHLRHGEKGICGHADASIAFPPNNGHTDPGPTFPWDFYLKRVQSHAARIKGAR